MSESHPAAAGPTGRARVADALRDGRVRVSIVTAIALLVQAVVAKNVLDVELDVASQNAALWVFIVFLLSGERGRAAELGVAVVVVAVTAAVLGLYAL